MVTRKKLILVFCIIFYIVLVFGYIIFDNIRQTNMLMEDIDTRLHLAAQGLKYMLEPDFHDRATDEDSISWNEIEQNRIAVSNFVFESDFEYAYTITEKDGRFYFTAPTVTPEEYEERKSWYFYPYDDPPPEYAEALHHNRITYVSYQDQWGTFRSIALPQMSPGGIRYLSCVDYEISYINGLKLQNLLFSFATAGFFLLPVLPFLIVYRRIMLEHNSELEAYKDHLEELVEQRTAELNREKLRAEEANRHKSRFLFNVSHELRTPLNGIMGFCEAIIENINHEENINYSKYILSESETLVALINDLLDSAKIEAGRMELEEQPFKLRALIENSLRSQKIAAERKDIDFSLHIAEDIPDKLEGDPFRLRQILLNLVSNAVKFTDAGSVSVDLSLKESHENSVTLKLTISDTGVGIPEDRQPFIFESFTQADAGTTRKYGGSGLGTSIAHQLVQLMGGRIDFTSIPGKGSNFFFTVPLKICAGDIPEEIICEPQQELKLPSGSSPVRILLADDYPANRKIIRLFLEKAGFRLSEAETGLEAVRLCSNEKFDLILMDIQMPVMDGYESAGRIREENSLNADTPIIALTASVDQETQERCIDTGMNGFLIKPIRKSKLISSVLWWLSLETPEEEPDEGGDTETEEAVRKSEHKPINMIQAMKLFDGDRDFFLTILKHFETGTDEQLTAIGSSLSDNDFENTAREAHKLKGASSLLAAEEIYHIAVKLEKAAEEANRDEADILYKKLKTAFERLKNHAELLTAVKAPLQP